MIGGLLAFTLFGAMLLSGAPLVVSLLAALAVIPLILALMGTLVERVAVRPLRRAFSLGWILSTVGVAVVLRNTVEVVWGREPKPVPSVFGENAVRVDAGLFLFCALLQVVVIL